MICGDAFRPGRGGGVEYILIDFFFLWEVIFRKRRAGGRLLKEEGSGRDVKRGRGAERIQRPPKQADGQGQVISDRVLSLSPTDLPFGALSLKMESNTKKTASNG